MKKTFILLAMLASVAASAQVTHVELVGANYASKTVMFRVWWNAGSRDATHLSKVWVWVDYIKINSNNTTSGNTWTRAAVSAASPTASISYDGSNRNGFWLQGNTSTNYSATLTVQLNITETKFNWCAYASDYPPNVTANNGTYTFKGTPPFTLIASDGATTQTVTGKTLVASALTITPTIIKDRSACPGVFCPYTGSDVYIDATHACQLRTSGAKNWTAWIKDSRDSKLYRIARLSTGLWTMDDYLNYSHSSAVTERCANADPNAKEYNRNLLVSTYSTLCPTGWRLPSQAEFETTVNEWSQYLDKVLKYTGETCNNGETWTCQTGYIAFLVHTCLLPRGAGQRLHATGNNYQIACQPPYSSGSYAYSGYARCVRDL
jgi:hypothetical protein